MDQFAIFDQDLPLSLGGGAESLVPANRLCVVLAESAESALRAYQAEFSAGVGGNWCRWSCVYDGARLKWSLILPGACGAELGGSGYQCAVPVSAVVA